MYKQFDMSTFYVNLDTVSLEANGNAFEVVKSAKILRVTVRNDLKWIYHVDVITTKASR